MYDETKVTTKIFPCKSITLLRFLKGKGIMSEHKYIDQEDGKTCWIFYRDDIFKEALNEDAQIKLNNKI
jgi:hypothetical protein